jgi:23S rRNA pseudouridine2605 synthase
MSRKPKRTPSGGDGAADRIAKVMARAGLCSRRDAEDWIAAGRVAINGAVIASPAVNVTARDRVTVDGKPLPRRERTRLFLYYKPVGLVSTNSDPQGRPTVFDALPANLPRLVSVGRLDIGTEGLLLLTNDGGLARVLELPDTAWVRKYRVRAHGRVTQAALDRLRDGITIDGIHYGPIEATLEHEQGANVWLGFAIREGKNREVRNVLTHLDLQVNRLIRVEFGPFGLGELAEGAVEEVETKNLRAQLGAPVIAAAGCDFTGPATARAAEPPPSRQERRDQRQSQRQDKRQDQRHDQRRDPRGPDRPREERRERGFAPRRDDERRPFRRSRTGPDERPEKPPGRPRRGHAWRQEDAPLRRTYRGSRREELKIPDEDRPDKRAGLVKDRKGRRVLVERFGTKKPEQVEAPRRAKPFRPPPRDRSSGPRPARPRPSDREAPEQQAPERRYWEPQSSEPRKFQPRPATTRPSGSRPFGPHKSGPRPPNPRTSGPRPSGPHKSGPRPPRPPGSRPPRDR